MQLSLIFGLFILARSKAINEDNKEVSTEKYPKIIGGDPTNIEEIPYQVSIRLRCLEEAAIGLGHYCGGKQIPKNNYQLVMGNTYLITESSTEKKYGVTDLRIHNSYEQMKNENDYNIAILFIDGVVPSEILIRPIGLTKSPVEVGTKCQISGWGARSELMEKTNTKSNSLRRGLVQTVDCNYSNEVPNHNSIICAGETGTNFCLIDRGGPLVCRDELAGVMLDFQACVNQNETKLYMSVLFYLDWIKEQNDGFDSKIRTKSITDSSASFDHRWHSFALLIALFNGFAY